MKLKGLIGCYFVSSLSFSIEYLWCGVESFSKASPYVAVSLHNTFADMFKMAVLHLCFPFSPEFEEHVFYSSTPPCRPATNLKRYGNFVATQINFVLVVRVVLDGYLFPFWVQFTDTPRIWTKNLSIIRQIWPIKLYEVRKTSFRSPLSTNWCSWFRWPRAQKKIIACHLLPCTVKHIQITILYWRYFADKAEYGVRSFKASPVTQ